MIEYYACPGASDISYAQMRALSYINSSSYAIGNMLVDGLLLWRMYVIWRPALSSARTQWLFILLPSCLIVGYAAVAVLGVIFMVPSDGSSASPIYLLSISASLLINVLLSLLIALRLWLYRRQIRAAFGKNYGKPYKLISLIIIESASLYVIFSILLLATMVSGNPSTQIWLYVNPPIQNIANMLIIYRLNNGKAWREEYSSISLEPVDAINQQSRGSPRQATLVFATPFTMNTPSESAHQIPHTLSLPASGDNDGLQGLELCHLVKTQSTLDEV
ncbi:hypothetical protein K474DRAFT_1670585 [Panus rudis PR-1116 ss-1]|nr:hypothetical protein K474DRAFT_1670585 [Panus rudis PR-1116 ss-1]